jgi:hypothetical protein
MQMILFIIKLAFEEFEQFEVPAGNDLAEANIYNNGREN